jgi:ATP-binding cassette subfamily F protein uup
MNILNIEHVSKVFGEKVIFDDVSYGIHEGDKIGIIGINGTGKSTLLKMLAGIEEPDSGQITKKNGLRVTYLPQNPEFPPQTTVLDYVTGNGEDSWGMESEAKTVLNRLGLTEHTALTDHLSGGQRKRAALAKTILHPADVLVLDEPTNHIDNEMATWLEDYLNRFKGVLIMVTHDRYFLDRVTNKILEIDHGSLYGYQANYSQFLELKAQREEMALASERKRQSVLRMELEWAKRGCRARTTKQRARLERLEALKNGRAPVSDSNVEMEAIETRMGKKTIELHQISKSYGEKKIIDDFTYIVLKNQRLGIIGPNGCGKSTLMKIITGNLMPDSGEVVIGDTVKIGYFAQEVEAMNENQRVIDYIKDVAEYIQTKEGRISASQMLERFLFDSVMQYTPIGKLSGGEKRRLYLLKVLSEAPNVLILDEPTNDLDIPTLTILEDYLDSFVGIVIAVSHDRYFLDNVVDRIFAFEGNGLLRQYEGGYTDYLEAFEKRAQEAPVQLEKKSTEEKTNSNKNWKQNRPVKLKFTYKEQKEYETIDDDIAAIEARIEAIEGESAKAATDFVKLNQLMKESEELKQQLDEKMERWVYLNDLAERIEAQKQS